MFEYTYIRTKSKCVGAWLQVLIVCRMYIVVYILVCLLHFREYRLIINFSFERTLLCSVISWVLVTFWGDLVLIA